MSILGEIYNGEYRPVEKKTIKPQEMRAKDTAFWDKAAEALGHESVDEHLYHLCEGENLDDADNFRKGFRLGVLLMLEVFCGEVK